MSPSNEIDSLTGLYTRKAFCHHAEEAIRNNPDVVFDIVISDFINFNHFNARYGTEKGDELLAKTGAMLAASAPDVICGRYGGDRFVSLVKHLDSFGIAVLENFQPPEQAKDEFTVESIVVKFGICQNVDGSAPVSAFCDRAYLALRGIKHTYGRNVAIYDPSMGKTALQKLFIEENMDKALKERQFQVYYQPKISLETGKISGAEALVRWIHPEQGTISPGAFIPIFEDNAFITKLDMYIWEKVCNDLAEWKQRGLPSFPISVNVSRRDFNDPDLSEKIISLVDRYQIPHSYFHAEVTESSFADDPKSVMHHVSALHSAGICIELDDFGSGYTSLSLLNDMNIDVLKLDISLLQKDKPDSERSVLLFAMQLAKMMHLQTIQEGVETEEQLERMKKLGCTFVQGYYFSRPLPKDEYEAYLLSNL